MVGEDFGLGVSTVVLKKSVITPKDREFFPTEAEWQKDKIIIHKIGLIVVSGNSDTDDMLVVPDNKVFYLTYYQLSLTTQVAGLVSSNFLLIRTSEGNKNIVKIVTEATKLDNSHISHSFIKPFQVNEKGILQLVGLASAGSVIRGECVIMGYLLDKKIIP